jgi:hypothetical protein
MSSRTNALVPFPSSNKTVSLSATDRQVIQAAFQKEVGRAYDDARPDVTIGRSVGSISLILCVATAASPPVLMVALPVGLMFCAAGGLFQREMNNAPARALERTKNLIGPRLELAQRYAYNAQKRDVMQVAENYLSEGGLLSYEDAAWLGNLDPATLKDAGDQLAITSLQVRKLLAYSRGGTGDKPLTFAARRLRPASDLHRLDLRERLVAADVHLTEDDLPVLHDLEFASEPAPKAGYLKALFNFVTPFSNFGKKRRFQKIQVPAVKDVEIPPVRPVADFMKALRAYEAANPPLDLPAVRGWKNTGPRCALPPPLAIHKI